MAEIRHFECAFERSGGMEGKLYKIWGGGGVKMEVDLNLGDTTSSCFRLKYTVYCKYGSTGLIT